MKTYTSEEWFSVAKNFYDLISYEIQNTPEQNLSQKYPQLVVMYEFFRLWRGEAFNDIRPTDIGEYQKEIYRMQDDLEKQLQNTKGKLKSDERTLFYLEQMKKSFTM